MKLEEIAKKAIEAIQQAGEAGITTYELSENLKVPKRRIYDINAIMKAANLVTTSRDKSGTRIFWNPDGPMKIDILNTKKVKIKTLGVINSVSNLTKEVIIECSKPGITVESVPE